MNNMGKVWEKIRQGLHVEMGALYAVNLLLLHLLKLCKHLGTMPCGSTIFAETLLRRVDQQRLAYRLLWLHWGSWFGYEDRVMMMRVLRLILTGIYFFGDLIRHSRISRTICSLLVSWWNGHANWRGMTMWRKKTLRGLNSKITWKLSVFYYSKWI